MRAHRFMLFKAFAALVLTGCLAHPARAAEDVWSLLPDETLGFVTVNNAVELSQEIQTFGKSIDAPFPNIIEALEKEQPVVAQLDASRPLALVLLRQADQFKLLGLLPVRDFQAFVKAGDGQSTGGDFSRMKLDDEELIAASKGGYALVTQAGNPDVLKAALENSGRTAQQLQSLRADMDQSDVAGAATQRGIRTLTKFARDALTAQAQKLRAAAGDESQAEMAAQGLQFYKLLIGGVAKNVQSYGFTMNLNEQGVVGRDTIILKDGPLQTQLADIAPSGIRWSDSLPAGQPVFMFAGVTPQSLGEEMLDVSAEIMVAMKGIYGLDRESIDKIIELSRPMIRDIKSMAFMLGLPEDPNAPLYAASGGFIKVEENAPKFIDSYIQLTEEMTQALEASDSSFMKFEKPEKMQIDGRPGVKLTVAFDFQKMKDDPSKAVMDTMMKRLYGEDGKLTAYFAATDDQTLVYGYSSRETLQRFAEALDAEVSGKRLGADSGYSELFENLPEDALWVGAVDIAGYMNMIKRMIGSMGAAQLLPSFGTAAPIGIGVSVKGNQCDVTWSVPQSTIKNMVQGVRNLRQEAMNAMPPQ